MLGINPVPLLITDASSRNNTALRRGPAVLMSSKVPGSTLKTA